MQHAPHHPHRYQKSKVQPILVQVQVQVQRQCNFPHLLCRDTLAKGNIYAQPSSAMFHRWLAVSIASLRSASLRPANKSPVGIGAFTPASASG
jgi:hypothetical protein